MNHRSGPVDALRVLGTLAVVAGHVWISEPVLMVIYTWHVPLFFFLTGYFWSPRRTLRTEVVKRLSTLAVPLLVWAAALGGTILVVLSVLNGFRPISTLHDFRDSQLPGVFRAFWFVFALFYSAVVFRLIERFPAWVQWAGAVVGVVITYIVGFGLTDIPLYLGLSLPSLIFVLAGYTFKKYRKHVSTRMAVGALLVAAVLIFTKISAPIVMRSGDLGTPVLSVLVALTLCVALVTAAEAVGAHMSSSWSIRCTRLASSGLAVVLGHAAVITVLGDQMPAGGVFILAAIVPWCVGLILLRTPISAYVNGTPRQGLSADAVPAHRL